MSDAKPLSSEAAISWLTEAAKYFSNRPTSGEDKAHWSNVYNAENCQKIIATITKAAAREAELKAQVEGLKAEVEKLAGECMALENDLSDCRKAERIDAGLAQRATARAEAAERERDALRAGRG